jgi:hypothetical protein
MQIKKPKRVARSYKQLIQGTPDEIMPLYCPVKEADWCEGWDPVVVYSKSGVVEPDCVFVTSDGKTESAWFVTQHNPEKGMVEMVKHTPGVTFVKLTITLRPLTEHKTQATITYSHISLGAAGDKVLAAFTEEAYETMMVAWEKAMNHYLQDGEMLTGLPEF